MANVVKARGGIPFQSYPLFREVIGPISLASSNSPDCSFILGKHPLSPFDYNKVDMELIKSASRIQASPETLVSAYEMPADMTESELFELSKGQGLHFLYDLRHISEVCRIHFLERKILSESLLSNIFFCRDSKFQLCILKVMCHNEMIYSLLTPFTPDRIRPKGQRVFFSH